MDLGTETEWERELRTCWVSLSDVMSFHFQCKCCLQVSLEWEIYHMGPAEACLGWGTEARQGAFPDTDPLN